MTAPLSPIDFGAVDPDVGSARRHRRGRMRLAAVRRIGISSEPTTEGTIETMTLEALANLGEFISGIVVIVSLIYLAVQIRQNTRSQRIESYARALDRIAALQARLSQTGEFSDILIKGTRDHRQLSERERLQFTWAFYEMFGAFEFMYHQSRTDSLPAAVWERWANTLLWWMSFPGVQAWWDARPTPFTPDFTHFIESHRSQSRPDSDAQRRWAQFLAGTEPMPRAVSDAR